MRAPCLSPCGPLMAGVALLSALAAACGDAPGSPFAPAAPQATTHASGADPAAACSPITTAALLADNGTATVGVVRVGNDESDLLVTLETAAGWFMTKTQLFVGPDAADIPRSGGGNATPGKFPYTRSHGAGAAAYTYAVPLSVLDDAATAVIAVHADVVLDDRKEGAWGEGSAITPGGSWGMYFTHGITDCSSDLVTVAEGGRIVFEGLTLVVPPGSVPADVQITVSSVDVGDLEPPAGQVSAQSGSGGASAVAATSASDVRIGNVIAFAGTAYDLGPDGLTFDPLNLPTITLAYDEQAVLAAGVAEAILGVFAINGVFFGLESTVDEAANTVSAQVPHFSTFFVGAPVGTVDLRLKGFGFSPATKLAGFPVTVHATAENVAASTDPVEATLRVDFDELLLFDLAELPAGCVASNPGVVELRFECPLGSIAPGQEVSRDLVITPFHVRTYAVVATVLPAAGDPTPNDNDQHGGFTTLAPVVDLRSDIVAPDIVDAGDPILYQMRVLNDAGSPNGLPSAVLRLEVAGDAEIVSLDALCVDFGTSATLSVIVQCSVLELAPGQAAFYDITLRATTPGQTLTGTARVLPPTFVVDTDPSNDAEAVDTRVRADLEADLSVVFTSTTNTVAKANLDFGYFLQVASDATSADAVAGAGLELAIAGPVTVASAPTACSWSSTTVPATTTVTCPVPDIAPNQTLPTVLIVVQPTTNAIGGTLEATATVSLPAGGVDPDASDDSAEHVADVVAPQIDMYVAQLTESADPVEVGATVRYTIQAGNRTSATDAAPDGSRVDLEVTAGDATVVSIPAGCTDFSAAVPEPVLVGCETGLLDFGEVSAAFEIELRPLAAGQLQVTAEARPRTGSIESNAADNTQVETTTVNAVAPQPSGQLAFMSTRVGPAALHTKNLGTGVVTMFVAGGFQILGEDPSWSADGTQIAIGGGSLRVIAASGASAPVTLPLGDLTVPRHPRWSPDGTKIVFQAVHDFDPDQDWELFAIDLATNAITRLTDNAVHDEAPDWAPDGSDRILFIRGGSSMRTVPAAGGAETEIRSGGAMRHARWSPDATEIAFSMQQASGWSIEKFAAATPGILTTLEDDGQANHSPVWSPTGAFVAFVKGEPSDDLPGIFYVLADGTGVAQVLESNPDDEDYDPTWKN